MVTTTTTTITTRFVCITQGSVETYSYAHEYSARVLDAYGFGPLAKPYAIDGGGPERNTFENYFAQNTRRPRAPYTAIIFPKYLECDIKTVVNVRKEACDTDGRVIFAKTVGSALFDDFRIPNMRHSGTTTGSRRRVLCFTVGIRRKTRCTTRAKSDPDEKV